MMEKITILLIIYITILDFIERIESIIGIVLISASYMKAAFTLWALNRGLSQLLKLQDNRILIFPLTMIAFLLTLVSFKNEAEFSDMVFMVWPLIVAIGSTLPILIMVGVTLFRKSYLPSSNSPEGR